MGTKTSNKWRGELGSKLDSHSYRARAFEAWVSWEYLQRGIAHNCDPVPPERMAELCGKWHRHLCDLERNLLHSIELEKIV